jgi:hypothetical protein
MARRSGYNTGRNAGKARVRLNTSGKEHTWESI